MLKKIIRSNSGHYLISWIVAVIICMIGITVRWRHMNAAPYYQMKKAEKPLILVSWHEHIIGASWFMPRPITTLNSPHIDGRVLGRAIQIIGLKVIWGSSNKQALSGLRQLAKTLNQGKRVGITPDGPRGPYHKLAMGPISLAHMTGAVIQPVVFSADRCWRLKSWDRTRIPKPFSKATILWGEPLHIPGKDECERPTKQMFEAWRLELETRLNQLTEDCDRLVIQNPKYTAQKNKSGSNSGDKK